MKILVLIKQTFDTETRIFLTANGQINDQGVSLVVDPYSEFAVEEALRIKERLGTGEVVILALGPERAETALRQCLAMGADRAVLISDPALEQGDEYTTAYVLAQAAKNLGFDLILAGYQAVDDGSAQVGARVARLLAIPQVTIVTKLELSAAQAVATREVDDGFEVVQVPLPALFTAQQGLAEPRYPTMKGIMQAKKKPMQKLTLSDLAIAPECVGEQGAKIRVEKFSLPPSRQAGKIIAGEPQDAVQTLVGLLESEAKVI